MRDIGLSTISLCSSQPQINRRKKNKKQKTKKKKTHFVITTPAPSPVTYTKGKNQFQ
jgi:hypothetical protein